MMNRSSVFVAALLAILVTACASPTVEELPADEFAEQGLHAVRSSGFENAYVHPDAGLSAYSKVDIRPLDLSRLVITQTEVQGRSMTEAREQSLTESWHGAMGRAFNNYPIEGNAKETLRIEAYLERVAPGRSAASVTTPGAMPVRGRNDTVDVLAEFRLYSDASGQLLAVIRDRQTIAALQWSRAEGAGMVSLFNSWAGLLHTRVSGR